MTGREAIGRLQELQGETFDTEDAHLKADKVLCELLKAIGYDDVIKEWHKVRKWYA